MIRVTNSGRRIDTDSLKRERPLADVVASYGITLRRESAGTYRALCPFHQEHTPSFWIDARISNSEHYFCFGCTSSGRWRPVRLPNSLDLAELAALGAAGREAFDILVGRARAIAWQQSRV